MSQNRWHAPYTCLRVNGRLATIYKAGGEGKKPKEKERWETEDGKKREKRERERGEKKQAKEREREREKVHPVIMRGWVMAVQVPRLYGPKYDSECFVYRWQRITPFNIRDTRMMTNALSVICWKFSQRLRCWLIRRLARVYFCAKHANYNFSCIAWRIIVAAKTQSRNLVISLHARNIL